MSDGRRAAKIIQHFILPGLALLGVAIGVNAAMRSAATVLPQAPISEPPRAPFSAFVAGAGIVEANTENIAIGTEIAGVVSAVKVEDGGRVAQGDPLFVIDGRAARVAGVTRR